MPLRLYPAAVAPAQLGSAVRHRKHQRLLQGGVGEGACCEVWLRQCSKADHRGIGAVRFKPHLSKAGDDLSRLLPICQGRYALDTLRTWRYGHRTQHFSPKVLGATMSAVISAPLVASRSPCTHPADQLARKPSTACHMAIVSRCERCRRCHDAVSQ